jgi:hypothetical protein
MEIVQARPEAENHAHVLYLVQGAEERLASLEAHYLSPWRPVGTLAVQIVRAKSLAHALVALGPSGRPLLRQPPTIARLLERVRRLQRAGGLPPLAPHGDLRRLRAVFRGAQLPAEAWRAVARDDLEELRGFVELAAQSYPELLRADFLARASTQWLRPRPVWAGLEGAADIFLVTPLVAVKLSALYGLARGRLRICPWCWQLFIAPARLHRQACPDCHTLRTRRRDRLAAWKQRRWRAVLHRMRMRGFRRLGLTDPKAQEAWRAEALRGLHAVRSHVELRTWEDQVAPRGRPGRPRTRKGGETT